MKKFFKKDKGFTLIELIVSMTIFVLVMSMVLGLFASSLKGQRKALALQDVQENAKYLLNFISKEIRMSTIEYASDYELQITRSDGKNITYFFEEGSIKRITSKFSESGAMNPEDIVVNGRFYSQGIGRRDGQQPRITIVIQSRAVGIKAEEGALIKTQTTVCPRNIEL